MPRVLMLLGLAALLALAAVLLLGESGEAPPARDGTRPETWRPQGAADASSGSREPRAPGLQAASKADAASGGPQEQGADEARAPKPTGPYRFVVRDHVSEAALENVEILGPEGQEELGRTDEDGVLEIEDAGVAQLEVRIRKSGYVEHAATFAPGETHEILLHLGVRIAGRVERSDGGSTAHASVIVWDEDLGSTVVTTRTDEDGRFVLRAVRPHHPLQLIVHTGDLAPHVTREVFARSLEDYVLRVGDGGVLRGSVRTVEGAPLPEVKVYLYEAGTTPLTLVGTEEDGRRKTELAECRNTWVWTDETGRFVFRGVPLEQSFQVGAWLAPHNLLLHPRAIRFEGVAEEQQVDLIAHAPAALRIRIEDETGEAVGGVRLTVWLGAMPLEPDPADRHPEGGYLIQDLMPGRLQARVVGELPGAQSRSATEKLESGKTREVRLVFPRGRELRGVVEDKRGEPIWKALVSWQGQGSKERVEVRTDADGSFELRRLQAESGTLGVSARDLPHTPRAYEGKSLEDVVPQAAPLRVTLLDGTRLTGSFTDLPAGTIVQSRLVPGSEFDALDLKLGEKGRFERRGPGAGWVGGVVFRIAGRPPLVVEERRPFTSEEVRDLGALRFEYTNPRKGRIVDESGRPVHGALVRITSPWTQGRTRTDEQGDFALPRMPDEPLPVEVLHGDYPTTPAVLHESSQYTRQTIPIRRSGVLVVVVEGAPRQAKTVFVGLLAQGTGERVQRVRGYRRPSQAVPVEGGRAVARFHVPPGRYTAYAMTQRPISSGASQVEVRTQATSVRVRLERRR